MIKRTNIICWLSALIPFIYFFILLPGMPEEVPTHFNAAGEPDDYGSPFVVLIALVAIVVPVNVILQYAPYIDPKQKLMKDQPSYQRLRIMFSLSMTAIALVIVHSTVNTVSIELLGIIIWMLFAIIGNYIQSVKHNYFIGVRTPWTLENEEVWRKTHRLFGRIMFFGGIGGAILSLIVEMKISMIVLVAFSVIVTIYAFYYSFKEHKKA